MTRTTRLRAVAAIVGIGLLASVASGFTAAGASTATRSAPAVATADPTGDIVATAQAAGSFTTLLAAAQAAGLVDALKGPGPLTVFAPTDAAFTKLLTALKLTPEQLLANTALLATVLKYHVVSGKVLSTDLGATTSAPTLADNNPLRITKDASGVTINGYAKVTTADVLATNGVIHVIDSVLIPFPPFAPDIVDTAAAAGSFTTLLAAAKAAGLVDALKGPGPFTVFAPTDAAFAKTLKRLHVTAAQLLADPAKLADILKYHVVSGKVLSTDLGRRTAAPTLEGKRIVIRKTVSKVGRKGHRRTVVRVTVNRTANVVKADIMASNGVIHVIDRVLIP